MPGSNDTLQARLRLALRVHGDLSALVAPATPRSIRASRTWPRLIPVAIGLGALGFVLLVGASLIEFEGGDTGAPKLVSDIQLIGAALLGATFNTLYKSTRFLREGTFDPSFQTDYIVKIVIGLFAGFILGRFGMELLSANNGGDDGKGLLALGPTTLALIGGFASQAVAEILQRIADTLVAMVRGPERERAQAEAQREVTRRARTAATKLQDALADQDAQQREQHIREVIRDLTK